MVKKIKKKKFVFGKRIFIPLLVLFIVGELVFLLISSQKSNSLVNKTASFEEYATRIVARCKNVKYRPTCYDREIPKIMDTISMEDSFMVTKIVQEMDPEYTYCHVLGHKLSAREINKDPSKWKEVATRCPSGVCSNGCVHGAFQERFRAEYLTDKQLKELLPDLKTLCEERDNWHPTGTEQGSCYHALGHLTMYLTRADIQKSVDLCDQVGKKDDGRNFSQLCYDGAYMQIYQPLETEDFELIKGKEVKAPDAFAFCAQFPTEQQSSCWTESWPLFRNQILTPEGLITHCDQLGDSQQTNRCYMALFYVVTAQLNFDQQKMITFCSGLRPQEATSCLSNSASRMLETDYRNIQNAVNMCTSSSDDQIKSGCFDALLFFAQYNFHTDSSEYKDLCNHFPQAWKNKCST